MEKLIVKNFGPIKEAEIDLTKFVVFIGDTSTGKSVLARLISIFRDVDFCFRENLNNFKLLLIDYNIDFEFENSIIQYNCRKNFEYKIRLENGSFSRFVNDRSIELVNSLHTVNLNEMIDRFRKAIKNPNPNVSLEVKEEGLNQIDKIYNEINLFPTHETIYFPAERILSSMIGNSISGLWANNVALPNYFKNFAAKYEVARKELKNANYDKFGFEYVFENGEDKIQFQNNKISLSQASIGVQSLIPLLVLFDYSLLLTEFRLDKSFLIEEPELNLYPTKQKHIIEYVVSKIQSTDDKLIITTHSPYILSSLDTLMLAKNTFNENPDLKTEISAIVDESKWIDYNEISVYEVRNDGKIYSIKNQEFKSIDTNAIDSVSDIISEEFDKLTELRYVAH